MKLLIDAIVFTFTSASAVLFGQAGRVRLVLDGSNTMRDRIDCTEKTVVGREVVSQILFDLPDDMQLELAPNGHREEESCEDIEVLLPFGEQARAELEAAVASVQPKGKTPVTAALLAAEGLDPPTQPVLTASLRNRPKRCSNGFAAWVTSSSELEGFAACCEPIQVVPIRCRPTLSRT